MSNYKFLIENNEGDTIYLAISETAIESRPIADCYDQYGNKIGSSDAGDCLSLNSQEAVDKANEIAESQQFFIGDTISAHENSVIFDALKKHEGVTLYQEEVRCITYFDNNYNTVYIGGDNPTYDMLDDADLEGELNKALEEKEYEEERSGILYYKHPVYYIRQSRFRSDFEAYRLCKKEQ